MKKIFKDLARGLQDAFNPRFVYEHTAAIDRQYIEKLSAIHTIMGNLRQALVSKERIIIAQEGIIANLRKTKGGALYYNPANHSEPTIKVCILFNDWRVVSVKRGERPLVLTEAEYNEAYSNYILLPLINNVKKFK